MAQFGMDAAMLQEIRVNIQINNYISIAMFALSTVAGLLRIYVRTRILKTFGRDDWAMVVAQGLFLICVLLVVLTNTWALQQWDGKPLPVSLAVFVQFLRWGYSTYIATVVAIKVSLALFMLRIFGRHHVWERVVIYTLTGIPGMIGLISILLAIATCAVSIGDPSCSLVRPFAYVGLAFSISNSLSDVAFASLAFIILWKMNMTKAAKISAGVLFTIGTIGGLASVFRVVAYFQHGSEFIRNLRYSRWSMIEAGICIIAVCTFTLRPLFRKILGPRFNMRTATSRQDLYDRSTLNKGVVADLQTHGLDKVEFSKDHHSSLVIEVRERMDSRLSGVVDSA